MTDAINIKFSLHEAAKSANVEYFNNLVVQEGYKINLHDEDNKTPFHIACIYGNVAVAKYLLDSPSFILPHSSNHEYTPFDLACGNGMADIVALLLAHPKTSKIYPNQKSQGQPPLHIACEYGHDDVVAALIDHPSIALSAVNDQTGDNLLHVAAAQKDTKMLTLILDYFSNNLNVPSIDPSLKNHQKQTPADVARIAGNYEGAKLLEEYKNNRLQDEFRAPELEAVMESTAFETAASIIDQAVNTNNLEAASACFKALLHFYGEEVKHVKGEIEEWLEECDEVLRAEAEKAQLESNKDIPSAQPCGVEAPNEREESQDGSVYYSCTSSPLESPSATPQCPSPCALPSQGNAKDYFSFFSEKHPFSVASSPERHGLER